MDVTDIIGPFGPFQFRILAVVCFRAISAGFLLLTYQLISFDVPFSCDKLNNDLEDTRSNYTFINSCSTDYVLQNGSIKEEQCENCFSFKYSNCSAQESLVQEWNLVCDREWFLSFGYLAFTLGNFLSYIPAGHMADKYGRRPLSIIGQLLIILSTLASSLSNSVELFMVTRVLTGISFGLTQNPFLCIFLESVGPQYRDFLVFSFAGAWGIGMMGAAAMTYVVNEWRMVYHLVNFFFQTPLLIMIWFVPESVRWLLTVGKNEEAERLLVDVAAQNRIVVFNSKSVMNLVRKKISLDEVTKRPTFLDLCRNRHLRKTTLIIFISFALTVFTYHGFMMTIGHFGGSLHMNVFLTGLVEIPVVVGYFLIVKFFDRRRGLLLCFFTSGSLFLMTLLIPTEMSSWRIGAALFGRLLNALAYAILYVFAAELFPTSLRAVALSGAMTFGRIGGMISPLADILARVYGRSVPITIYGILSIATSLILLLLPETMNKPLPDTVEESVKLAITVDENDIHLARNLLVTNKKGMKF